MPTNRLVYSSITGTPSHPAILARIHAAAVRAALTPTQGPACRSTVPELHRASPAELLARLDEIEARNRVSAERLDEVALRLGEVRAAELRIEAELDARRRGRR